MLNVTYRSQQKGQLDSLQASLLEMEIWIHSTMGMAEARRIMGWTTQRFKSFPR